MVIEIDIASASFRWQQQPQPAQLSDEPGDTGPCPVFGQAELASDFGRDGSRCPARFQPAPNLAAGPVAREQQTAVNRQQRQAVTLGRRAHLRRDHEKAAIGFRGVTCFWRDADLPGGPSEMME
jgi:hypothetical protein